MKHSHIDGSGIRDSVLRALTLLLAMTSVSAFADEATEWLDRMGRALKEQNYQGTFTYMRGSQFETIRVMHRYNEGVETEKLVHLNGEERQVIRRDRDVECFHVDSGSALLDHNVPLGPFSAAFNEDVSNSQQQYKFSLHGEDRIADRPAVKLMISPSDNDRYGYRLWLDEETGLLLQSHLVDRGRVLELFQFTDIEIGPEIGEEHLLTSLDSNAISHRLSAPEAAEAVEAMEQERPVWRAAWLPKGFRPIQTRSTNRLHFTDGFATLSIFVEKKGGLPEMTTQHGATTFITRKLKGNRGQITVVGEVPASLARRVAENIEPVIY